MDSIDPDRRLAEWRVDAAASRRRSIWRDTGLLAGETTWSSVLGLAAAHRTSVVVTTETGARVAGQIVAIGADVVVIERPGEAGTTIASARIVGVISGETTLGDHEVETGETTLVEILTELADSEVTVSIVCLGGLVARGRIDAVSDEVVVVADGNGRRTYVRVDRVSEVSSMAITSSSR